LKNSIKKILDDYVSYGSITNTKSEAYIDKFFESFFSEIPYFLENPKHFGKTPLKDDRFSRSVNWGFVKGEGDDTVVFIHHSDVVTIDNYNELKKYALFPDKLKEKMKENIDTFSEEVKKDYFSEKWMFGRGTADMKGGGSIQLALLKKYS